MQTILDEGHTWFLDQVRYADKGLEVVVAEGFVAEEPEDIQIGELTLQGTHAISTTGQSRRVLVRFFEPVAWQLVDESFTAFAEYEERDDESSLQVLTRSRYLDYVLASHGWFVDIRGPGNHYRLWTENEVLDVVTCRGPDVAWLPAAAELLDEADVRRAF